MRLVERIRGLAWPIALGWIVSAVTLATAHAAEVDSTAARSAARGRLSWTADRMPLKVGDLVTVVVDEQAAAREHVTRVSTGDRGLNAALKGHVDTGGTSTPSNYDIGVSTGLGNSSRDVGDAQRTGGLTAVLTVRVTGFEAEDVARIEGHKQVTVDGRTQDVMLRGSIRGQDVTQGNTIRSTRIADAVITYKGKKLSPNSSLVGKLLGMVWP
jgi:flagellar L-ring protein precursor FlgH